MSAAIILYTPTPSAIVPLAPACVRRETTFKRVPKPAAKTFFMPDGFENQIYIHKRLLELGYKPVQWEVLAAKSTQPNEAA